MSHRSIKLKIEPAVLKYARYCSGYEVSEVARKIKMKQDKLVLLESEGAEISIAQLEKIAKLYKIPLAYFFLKRVPKDVILPEDFRIIYASEREKFSPAIMLAVRRARYIQSVIQELSEEKIEYKFRHVSISDDVEKIASDFRLNLGVSIKDQRGWSNPVVALRNWKDEVEKLKIFISQQSLPEEDVSAFSLGDKAPYIIVLNSSEHENRRIFSLIHEIGHILLHGSGVCTPNDFSRNSFEYIRIEKFCNQFAASFLVPYEEFVRNKLVQKIRKIPLSKWDHNDIRKISEDFRVSQEVIYRRLVSVGILEVEEYEKKRSDLIRGFKEYKKRKKKERLLIPQYIKIISRNGRAYSSFILENLYMNRITLAEAANFLDTNSRHISRVESNI